MRAPSGDNLREDLEHYDHDRSLLHDPGKFQVNHGLRLHLFNLDDERRETCSPGYLVALADLGFLLLIGAVL